MDAPATRAATTETAPPAAAAIGPAAAGATSPPAALGSAGTAAGEGRPRSLRPTPAGIALTACAGLALAVAVAAAGTPLGAAAGLGGGLAVGVLALGAPLACANLAGVAVPRARAVTAMAGEGFELGLRVEHRRRGRARDVALQPGADARRRPAAVCPDLAPGAVAWVRARHRVARRGLYAELELTLSSTFPFGVWRAARRVTVPARLWILPRALTVTDAPEPDRARRELARSRRVAPRGEDEFARLRERRTGEPPRRAHWPLSLRRGRTLLREHQAEAPPPVRVWLSCFVPVAGREARRLAAFERAVSLAASLVVHYARRGLPVELVVAGARVVRVPAARGSAALLPAMLALADAVPSSHPLEEPLLPDPERTVVVLAGDGRGPSRAHAVPAAALCALDVDRATDALLVRTPSQESFTIGPAGAGERAPRAGAGRPG